MKGSKFLHRMLSVVVCLVMLLTLAVQAAAAEIAHVHTEQPQGGNQEGLILLLSAVAITGLILLIVIRWGKKKFF